MERSDDESSSPVTANKESSPFHHHHHSDFSADVITQRATCSGDGEEVAPGDLTICSQVSSCHGPEGGGHCGGRTTRGTHHLDKPTSQVGLNPVSLASDSDTQERDLPFDPRGVNSDNDAYMTEPPLPGELTLPSVTAVSRNTFECCRRQTAPGQLVQDGQGSESELQSRRPGIVEYFSR